MLQARKIQKSNATLPLLAEQITLQLSVQDPIPQLLGTIKFVSTACFAVFLHVAFDGYVLRFFGPAMTWVMGSRVNLGLVARILCFFVSLPVWINERPTRPDGCDVKRV